MKQKTLFTLLALTSALVIVTGCTSTAPDTGTTANFPDKNRGVSMKIPKKQKPAPKELEEPDRNNPREVITFARHLSEAGKNSQAAQVYLDAAKRFDSVNNRFESDCRKAAVREYWLAGNLDKARSLLNEMQSEQDLYARAAEDENLKKLRKLLNKSR